MPDGDVKTYTQEEVDQLVTERNTALEQKRTELLAEAKAAKDAERALRAQMAELEQQMKAHKAGITSEQLEKLRADVRAEVDQSYEPTKAELAALRAEARALKLDSVVKAEMAKHGARADRIEALFKLTSGQYDLTEDGKPMLRERPGIPVEKFIADEVRTQYPEFFEGTGSSGGGAPRSVASGAGVRVIPAGDNKAFVANLKDIASGKVEVR